MSLAVWLGEDRKCSAAVVGLDLLLGLSKIRRCSLNRSFHRRFVSPMYCKLQQLLINFKHFKFTDFKWVYTRETSLSNKVFRTCKAIT